jgi:predicted deacylase
VKKLPQLYPVDLEPPDIAPYKDGNGGIDYVHRLDSGERGPHVLVTALVHGNEICGAIALDWLFKQKFRPTRGILTLAFCNVVAYRHFDPKAPGDSRFMDEDFNRVWSPERLGGKGKSAANLLLDIHSMQHKTPALTISGPLEKGRRLAREIAYPALVVSDEGHAGGRRMRDYGAFGDPTQPQNSLLVECGQHWEKASETVAKQTLVRFLAHAGIADPAWVARHLSKKKSAPQRLIEVTHAVTIKSPEFRFVEDYRGLEVIAKKGSVLAHDGPEPVRTPYDDCVLIMPSRRLLPGQTAVRLGRFLD